METLAKLDKFIGHHKSTSTIMEHENGYGSASWSVTLLSHIGQVYACGGYLDDNSGVAPVIESEEYNYCGWLVNTAWHPQTLYVSLKNDVEECANAEQVLRAALDYWEKITGIIL